MRKEYDFTNAIKNPYIKKSDLNKEKCNLLYEKFIKMII